ncbi:hypothetical protein [Hydrogenophaga crassostreae]|uniref:hypothetical protein n=1 Tax=Hydrogenophaga crassostreae TaxID=1763535 RepID=UPI0018D3D27E|nr:hypothetical protein [Hydrogenophaga crassostreae]
MLRTAGWDPACGSGISNSNVAGPDRDSPSFTPRRLTDCSTKPSTTSAPTRQGRGGWSSTASKAAPANRPWATKPSSRTREGGCGAASVESTTASGSAPNARPTEATSA